MLKALHQLELRFVALILLAVFAAGGLGRSVHAFEHSAGARAAHATCVAEALGCDAADEAARAGADVASSDSDRADAAGDCALCLMSAQRCVLAPGAAFSTVGAAAQARFPSPQAAPRAGPRGTRPARAPPTAARA